MTLLRPWKFMKLWPKTSCPQATGYRAEPSPVLRDVINMNLDKDSTCLKRTIKYCTIIPPNSQGIALTSSHCWNLTQMSRAAYKPEMSLPCGDLQHLPRAAPGPGAGVQLGTRLPLLEGPAHWKQRCEGGSGPTSRVDSHFCVTVASVFSSIKKNDNSLSTWDYRGDLRTLL